MANFPSAGITIPDKIAQEDIPKYLRQILVAMNRNAADIQRAQKGDPSRTDARIATGVRGMAHDRYYLDNPSAAPGDIAYLVDRYNWTFGSVSTPGAGGGTPTPISNPHVLLDGVEDSDTNGGAIPVRGDLIVRSAGNLWDILSIQPADTFMKSDGTDPSWQAALGKTGAAKVSLGSQSAGIGSTNLIASPATGVYLVSYTILTTTLDATAGTIQFQINYTDSVGATTQVGAALALTALGRDRGTFTVQIASGALSYQTNVVGAVNAARYALFVRVAYLG